MNGLLITGIQIKNYNTKTNPKASNYYKKKPEYPTEYQRAFQNYNNYNNYELF